MELNPVLLEVFKNRFIGIADEMGVTLNRTAFSPNIKERRDFSCAIFDENGDMIAQAAHIPVHLGSMPLSVEQAIKDISFCEDDMVILNDPFKGGTHLPDITIISPVFLSGYEKPKFYVANRAHHADIGGMTAGSMPLSTTIFQEGIIIPPLKLIEKGHIDGKIMRFILNNVRTPLEREGDFAAQIMANKTGIKRTEEIIRKYGLEMVEFYSKNLMDYSERFIRNFIKSIPDGSYEFCDYMDDDGQFGENIKIYVKLNITGSDIDVDFSVTDKQVAGNINAVYSITLSSVLYVFRSLIEADIPTNAGCFKPLRINVKKGSLLDANFPAAVAAGNVETSQRIVDVLLGALSAAIPEKIPAASQGTMNNITIGGFDEDQHIPFTYYETIGGGMGAAFNYNGESAIHSHMTNTLNTPVEALEFSYPLEVIEYSIRKGSGGSGCFKGGDGIVRDVKVLCDAEVTVLSERRKIKPYGLFGGGPGVEGKNYLICDNEWNEMSSKFTVNLKKGSRIRLETPGGGGFKKNG